jgi:hypothetical protein
MMRRHNLGAEKVPWHELRHTRYIKAAQNVPAFLSSIEEPASARFTACGSADSSAPGGSPATVFMEQYNRRMRYSRHWAYGTWDIQWKLFAGKGARCTHRGESGTRKAIAEGDDLIEEVVVGLLGCLRELNLAN